MLTNRRVYDVARDTEDWRTDAQTDIDRISYSTEFRRLAGVTQVIPPQDDYLFHDRLTHSMKVAQVAATIARKLIHEARDNDGLRVANIDISDWIDPDYCYAAGLAHDIGHPPFGHAGEQALQEIFLRTGVAASEARSFEGNAQSTRIVASLSFRKVTSVGLDLRLRTMAAIAKYPWRRHEHPHGIAKLALKWSFYEDEAWILTDLETENFIAVERTPAPPAPQADGDEPPATVRVQRVHRWPEAEIMDWADDVSYGVHDLEDFYKSGRIPLHRIRAGLRHSPDASSPGFNWSTTDFSFAQDDEEIRSAFVYARQKMERQLDDDGRSLAEHIPAAFEVIKESLLRSMPVRRFDGSELASTTLQAFGSAAITYLTKSTWIDVIHVHGIPRVQFRVDPRARLVAEFFKSLCQYYVIESSMLTTMQAGQARIIRNLVEALRVLSESSINRGGVAIPARLETYLKRAHAAHARIGGDQKPGAATLVAIVDYICSLRDLQTSNLEATLTGRAHSLTFANTWLDT